MDDNLNLEGNPDIQKALKEFEQKSNAEQMQKDPEALKTPEIPKHEVGGVKFEVPSYGAVKYYQETTTPKMVQKVIKWSGGAIKEQKQAEYILLGFVVVAIGISLFLFINTIKHPSPPPTDKIIWVAGPSGGK